MSGFAHAQAPVLGMRWAEVAAADETLPYSHHTRRTILLSSGNTLSDGHTGTSGDTQATSDSSNVATGSGAVKWRHFTVD